MPDRDQDAVLREAARARGFRLVKSRRRKPGGDFGRYGLVDLKNGRECFGFGSDGLTGTVEGVHAYLRGGEVASWKRSLIGVVGEEASPTRSAPPAEPRKRSKKKEGPPPAPPRNSGGKSGRARTDSPPAFVGGAGGGPSSSTPPPPPPLAIRDATRRDAAALAKLLSVPAAQLAERLAAAVRADEPPLVAERGRELVGCCAWTLLTTLQHGTRGRITLLFVAEGERRRGTGSALLGETERRLSDAGVAEAELLLEIDFDAPAGFLRRTGWERTANGYGKPLSS
jgi:N-acetylglutamate synthase-like GNAT family acetyltransferase